jgi:Acyl-CoA carboxylase epsilon subunit
MSTGLQVRGAVTPEELAALLAALHSSGEREQRPSTYEAWRARRIAVLRPARTPRESNR